MASRSLGTLTLDLIAKIGGYTEGLGKAEREAQKRAKAIEKAFKDAGTAIGASLATAFTGAVAGLAAFDQLIKAASDFQDIAERIGGTGEGIASFAVAAGIAGTDMETVAAASIKLSASLTEVDDESKAAGAALVALGLNIEEFKKLGAEARLEALAKAMAQFEDSTGKTAAAVAIFGKSGAQLLPFLKTLEEQGGRQVILTQQQIDLADEYADKQAKATTELRLYAQQAATQALPALTSLTNVMSDLLKGLIGVDKETGALAANNGIRTFAESAISAVAFVVDAFTGLYTVVSRTGEFIGATGAALVAVIKGNFEQLAAIREAYNTSLETGFDSLRSRVQEQFALQRQLGAAVGGGTTLRALNFNGAADRAKAAQKQKQEIDDNARALAQYVQQLQKQIDKELELTQVQQARQFLTTLGKTGEIPQVRELVLALAERIDKEKELNEEIELRRQAAIDAGDAAMRAYEAERAFIDGMLSQGPAARLEKQRQDLMRLADLVGKEGGITPEQFEDAATGYLGLQANIEKTKSLADELGLSFTSAFEDAIVGGRGLSEVLKGLEQDILRIVTRKLVTEPLGNTLTGFLGNAFGTGGSGGASGMLSGLFSKIGNFFGFMADGGNIPAGGWAIAGEAGPEVITGPATVTPMGKVGATYNITIPVQGNVDTRTRQQIAATVAAQVQRADLRNN